MQIFGTRFHVSFGSLQLRVGFSLEDQSDAGLCGTSDSPMFVAQDSSPRDGRRTEVRS